MARISEIRKGLKDACSTISGLRAYATMPISPDPPCVVPKLVSWRHHEAFLTGDGGSPKTYLFILWIYVGMADLNQAQTMLDDCLSDEGPKSVSQAVEKDSSLGGVVDNLQVLGGNDYGPVEYAGGQQLLAGGIQVEIYA